MRQYLSEHQRFSLRKLSIGLASVFLGTSFVMMQQSGMVKADTINDQNTQNQTTNQNASTAHATDGSKQIAIQAPAKAPTQNSVEVKTNAENMQKQTEQKAQTLTQNTVKTETPQVSTPKQNVQTALKTSVANQTHVQNKQAQASIPNGQANANTAQNNVQTSTPAVSNQKSVSNAVNNANQTANTQTTTNLNRETANTQSLNLNQGVNNKVVQTKANIKVDTPKIANSTKLATNTLFIKKSSNVNPNVFASQLDTEADPLRSREGDEYEDGVYDFRRDIETYIKDSQGQEHSYKNGYISQETSITRTQIFHTEKDPQTGVENTIFDGMTPWTTSKLPKYTVPDLKGYTHKIKVIDEFPVDHSMATDWDKRAQSVRVVYDPIDCTFTLNMFDAQTKDAQGNEKLVWTQTYNGKAYEHIPTDADIPGGYKLAEKANNTLPESHTFFVDPAVANVELIHDVQNTSGDDEGAQFEITRPIYFKYLDRSGKQIGQLEDHSQQATLTRTASTDEATGETEYGSWSNCNFDGINIKDIIPQGYVTSIQQIDPLSLNSDQIESYYKLSKGSGKYTLPETVVSLSPQAEQVQITYLDDDNGQKPIKVGNQVYTSTITGRYGQEVGISFNANGQQNAQPDNNNRVTVIVPANYQLSNGSEVPATYTFSSTNDPLIVHVSHQIDRKKSDSKQVKRVITYDYYAGSKLIKQENQTQQATVEHYTDVDKVTGKTIHDEWQTAKFSSIDVPKQKGYTASEDQIDEDRSVDGNDALPVRVVYTANDSSLTINYVDANTKQTVDSQTVSGYTDETIKLNYQKPSGYVLSGNLPITYTFKPSEDSEANDTMSIQVAQADNDAGDNSPQTKEDVTKVQKNSQLPEPASLIDNQSDVKTITWGQKPSTDQNGLQSGAINVTYNDGSINTVPVLIFVGNGDNPVSSSNDSVEVPNSMANDANVDTTTIRVKGNAAMPNPQLGITWQSKIPNGIKYHWLQTPDLSYNHEDSYDAAIVFPDGSGLRVPINVNVIDAGRDTPYDPNTPANPDQPTNPDEGETLADKFGSQIKVKDNITYALNQKISNSDAKNAISNISNLPSGTNFIWEIIPSTNIADTGMATIDATFSDGSTYNDILVNYTVVDNATPVNPDNPGQPSTTPDNEKYKPIGQNLALKLNSQVPDAKSAIKNADTLPSGTTYAWENEPFTGSLDDVGSLVNVDITYPDKTTDQVQIRYTVVDQSTPTNPDKPDQPNKPTQSDSDKYTPIGQDLTLKLNSKAPDAKTAIKNASELPNGTTYAWENEPSTSSVDDAGSIAYIDVTYPDKSMDQVSITYKVAENAPDKPDQPDQPDKPATTPDNEKYSPIVKTLTLKQGSKVPDAKSAIQNANELPNGAQYVWTNAPDTATIDDAGSYANLTITYPDKTTSDLAVNYKVVANAPDNPDKPNTPDLSKYKDNIKYSPIVQHIYLKQYSQVPDARIAIKNADELPNGTKFEWYNGTPVTTSISYIGSGFPISIRIVYPDKSGDSLQTTYSVVTNVPSDPDLPLPANTPNVEDNEKYNPAVRNLVLVKGQAIPDAKTAVTNIDKMPVGTHYNWDMISPDTSSTDLFGDFADLIITFPDGSTTRPQINYYVINADNQDQPSTTPDNEKYSPTVKTLTLKQGSQVPDAKSAIANAEQLPNGTQYVWTNAPDTTTVDDAGSYANLTITYPDNSTCDLMVNYKVVSNTPDQPDNPDNPDQPSTTPDNQKYKPIGQDLTLKLNSKAPDAKTAIKNASELPNGTTYTWENEPSTSSIDDAGSIANINITYPDKTTDQISITYKVAENVPDTPNQPDNPDKPTQSDSDKYKPIGQDLVLKQGSKIPDAKSAIKNASELPNGTIFSWESTPDTSSVDDAGSIVNIDITYPDKSTDQVSIRYTVSQNVPDTPDKPDNPDKPTQSDSDKYTPMVKTLILKQDSQVPDAKTAIANADQLPSGTTYSWDIDPDTSTIDDAGSIATITITYPDKSTTQVSVTYKVSSSAPSDPNQPDNPDKPSDTPDNEKYSPIVKTLQIKQGSKIPDAKSAIQNADDLPNGTKFIWDNAPDTDTLDSAGSIANMTVVYPDSTTLSLEVHYTVVAGNTPTNPDQPDNPDQPSDTPDNEKYQPIIKSLQLKQNSEVPDAKTAVANANNLPKGTIISWENAPDTATLDDAGSIANIMITYPDNTQSLLDVHYTVVSGSTNQDNPDNPDNPDKPSQTPDNQKYSAITKNFEFTQGDKVPDAKTAISNLNDLPSGIKVEWTNEPNTGTLDDAGSIANIMITYPDSSTTSLEVSYTVKAKSTPVNPDHDSGDHSNTNKPSQPDHGNSGDHGNTDNPDNPNHGNSGDHGNTDNPDNPNHGNSGDHGNTDSPDNPNHGNTGDHGNTNNPDNPNHGNTGNQGNTDNPSTSDHGNTSNQGVPVNPNNNSNTNTSANTPSNTQNGIQNIININTNNGTNNQLNQLSNTSNQTRNKQNTLSDDLLIRKVTGKTITVGQNNAMPNPQSAVSNSSSLPSATMYSWTHAMNTSRVGQFTNSIDIQTPSGVTRNVPVSVVVTPSSQNNNQNELPQTGDENNNTAAIFGALAMSMGTVALAGTRRKKRN